MGRLVVSQWSVPMMHGPPDGERVRIAHVSDLHLRGWSSNADLLREALRELQPDMLVVTGDSCDDPTDGARVIPTLGALLEDIAPPLGTYGVLGNHDDVALAEADLPITFLRNESRRIDAGRFGFRLAGIDQPFGHRSGAASIMPPCQDEEPLVVLAHYPSTVFELPANRGILMLAGHTHGGQIRLPGVGALVTNDHLPRAMARGLHTVRGNWLHVTCGVGASGPLRWRFCCPAEVALVELRGAGGDAEAACLAPSATVGA